MSRRATLRLLLLGLLLCWCGVFLRSENTEKKHCPGADAGTDT